MEIHLKQFACRIALDYSMLEHVCGRGARNQWVVEESNVYPAVVAGVRMGHQIFAPAIGGNPLGELDGSPL